MKWCMLIAIMLFTSSVSYAQKKDYTVHNIEVIGGIGWTKADYIQSNIFTGAASYAYSFNKYFGLGAGLSYDATDLIVNYDIDGAPFEESKCNMFSLYGTVRGYLPTYSKHISFIGVVDVGAANVDLAETTRYQFPSGAFMCSPQLGIRIKIMKERSLALNARLYYRHYCFNDNFNSKNFGVKGILFGISF